MSVSQDLVLNRSHGKIFRNEAILLYPSEPIPELINSNLLKQMKEILDRFLQGRISSNILLYGSSGSGKTTLVQRLVSDLSPRTNPYVFLSIVGVITREWRFIR